MTVSTFTWDNANGGAFSIAANWTGGAAPDGGADDAILATLAKAYTVTSASNEQLDFLQVDASVTLSLTGGVFAMNSTVNPYSIAYNFGTISIGAAATFSFQSANSAEINGPGQVDDAGDLLVVGTYFLLVGGTLVLSGAGQITGATSEGESLNINNATIKGFGLIGDGASATGGNGLYVTNFSNGVIDADGAAALTLNTGSNAIENAGVIETTGAGGLTIASSMYDDGSLLAAGTGAMRIKNEALVQSGGTLTVDKGASVVLKGGMISIGGVDTIAAGGSLSTTSGTTLGIGANGNFVGDVLQGPDIEDAGQINIADDSTLNLNASIYNSGAIDLKGSSGPTTLEVFGNGLSLYETGGLVLSNSENNFIVGDGQAVQLTVHSNLSGAGVIGDGWLRFVVNAGATVNADDADALTINGDTLGTNAGTESSNYNTSIVETTGQGGLTINGIFANAGSLIAAGAGALTLNGAFVTSGGGVVKATGSGTLVLADNAQIYNQAYVSVAAGATLETTTGDTNDVLEELVFNSGAIDIVDGSTLEVRGHWSNDGTINLEAATKGSVLQIQAANSLELQGAGALVMSSASDSILSAGAGATLNNLSNTIDAIGTIGDANMTVNNDAGGTIETNGAGTLTIDAQALNNQNQTFLYNAGVIKARAGGTIDIEAAMSDPGRLVAKSGGYIDDQAVVYGPGLAKIVGTGKLEFAGEVDSDIVFESGATGSLVLDAANVNDGNIFGFGAGDTIDLRNFTFVAGKTVVASLSSFGSLDGELYLSNGASTSAPLYLEGNFTSSFLASEQLKWQFASDGHNGTNISLVSSA